MKVWIVHLDVVYEFGQVLGCFSSREKAFAWAITEYPLPKPSRFRPTYAPKVNERQDGGYDWNHNSDTDISIEEWEVT